MQLSRVCDAEQVFYDLGSGTGKTVPLAPYNAYVYMYAILYVEFVCKSLVCKSLCVCCIYVCMFMPYTEVVLLAAPHRPVLHFTRYAK